MKKCGVRNAECGTSAGREDSCFLGSRRGHFHYHEIKDADREHEKRDVMRFGFHQIVQRRRVARQEKFVCVGVEDSELGVHARVSRELVKVENDDDGAVELGIEYATRQCEQLIKHGIVGLHFYSLNKSYSLQAIWKNLGL